MIRSWKRSKFLLDRSARCTRIYLGREVRTSIRIPRVSSWPGWIFDRWNGGTCQSNPVVDVSPNGGRGFFFSKRRNASGKDLCAGCGLKRSRKRSQGLQTLTYRSSFLIDDGDTSGAREVSKSWRGKWHDSARFCNGMIVCWESWQTTG